MRVFKFGGASVKDANSIKNVVRVLKHEGFSDVLIIISAMGKMTNAFENIVDSYIKESDDLTVNIEYVREFHRTIIVDLFKNNKENMLFDLEKLLGQLSGFFISNKNNDYNFIYDQIVGYGELISTAIVSCYLNEIGISNKWIDVREFVKTDSNYRDAHVNWEETALKISEINASELIITQGFLGANSNGITTTLGREGSDYSAAIFAYCLDAESVTIWKDVEGVLNSDPRSFENSILLEQISYNEAIEMAFYGASVIHPKTLKPLENKKIPLFVRSFYNLSKKGTIVKSGLNLFPEVPCFILKKQQILIAISAQDFSFMVEHNLSDIFKILHNYKLKVNLIQNSALSFSVCVEDKFNNFKLFLNDLTVNYSVNYVENVSLYTVRHATENAIKLVEGKGKILLKQVSKGTVQLVMQ
ncbi:aspartate kinase [Lutibacter citreus]|uniref:aspartate kinase n=1 Tax=Lutibacter citreus TaxID=2138210 RepID=UPI000DBE2FE8|nr:aspartate kinase [Lutibacter citreus]